MKFSLFNYIIGKR